MFHLVLTFDTTYKSNRYQFSLLEIISVTLTKLTIFVEVAYLEYEREKNFTRALENLSELFNLEKLISNIMVTNP